MKRFLVLAPAMLVVLACKSESAPEPRGVRADPQGSAMGGGGAMGAALPKGPKAVPISPDDPRHGVFTLTDALAGVTGQGDLVATITTSHGNLTCRLYEDKAPITVANFAGLARGTRPWKDPKTGSWVTRPAYDGTLFHRIIKGFMIQGGDAKGDGSGGPGYVIPDELWDGAKHDRPGLLCMANRGPDTNGAQFFIMDGVASHLDKGYTIFGECGPVPLVHLIAAVPTGPGDKPTSPVTIKSIAISRGAAAAVAPPTP